MKHLKYLKEKKERLRRSHNFNEKEVLDIKDAFEHITAEYDMKFSPPKLNSDYILNKNGILYNYEIYTAEELYNGKYIFGKKYTIGQATVYITLYLNGDKYIDDTIEDIKNVFIPQIKHMGFNIKSTIDNTRQICMIYYSITKKDSKKK